MLLIGRTSFCGFKYPANPRCCAKWLFIISGVWLQWFIARDKVRVQSYSSYLPLYVFRNSCSENLIPHQLAIFKLRNSNLRNTKTIVITICFPHCHVLESLWHVMAKLWNTHEQTPLWVLTEPTIYNAKLLAIWGIWWPGSFRKFSWCSRSSLIG